MGSAHYIVLEREIEGLETMIDGKRLSRIMESLDTAALQLEVRPLSEFFSMDPEELREFREGADEVELPPLQQFQAQDGLASVRALLTRPESQPAIQDLKDCERILSVAAEHGVGWHFQIDI